MTFKPGVVNSRGGSKFNEATRARIVLAVGEGNYLAVAARAAGVHPATLRHWLADEREEYREFAEAVESAQAQSELSFLATVAKASVSSWQAACWILERSHPERWALRTRAKIDTERLMRDQCEALAEQYPGIDVEELMKESERILQDAMTGDADREERE